MFLSLSGHASVGDRSHHNGWKIDIRKRGDDCITRYIIRTFTKISSNRWQAASGNIYLNEGNHWDIQYNAARRHRRSVNEVGNFQDSRVYFNPVILECSFFFFRRISTEETTELSGEEPVLADYQQWAENSDGVASDYV